ncbi:MAG: glucosamine-6-phosphate deaminase, partial [Candidatus Omnitrophica bacterium]|nr:glucosamine-6-phosphate deaminase [Candidatus Omnitrophota bacterium]
LLGLDQKELDYENEKIETDEYLKYLTGYIQKFNIPTSKYRNISLLSETIEQEGRIDQIKIMQQSQSLLLNLQAELARKDTRSDLDALIVKARLFKEQKISPFSFYSYLKDLALKHIPEYVSKYQNLNEFVDYLTKVNSLDSTKLFNEMEDLSYEVKQRLAKNNDQKELIKALRNIKFLEGFFNLKVSNEELDYYLANKESHKVNWFKSTITNLTNKTNSTSQAGYIDYNPDLIDNHLQGLEDFYKTVKARDVAMVRNSVSEIEKRNTKVSALISGGFHTKGITRMLREHGYSYIVISPYSSTDIDEENYHFLLSGKRKPITELLKEIDLNEVIDRLSPGLRISLGCDTDIREALNNEVAPQIARMHSIPLDDVRVPDIIARITQALFLQRGAARWDAPLDIITRVQKNADTGTDIVEFESAVEGKKPIFIQLVRGEKGRITVTESTQSKISGKTVLEKKSTRTAADKKGPILASNAGLRSTEVGKGLLTRSQEKALKEISLVPALVLTKTKERAEKLAARRIADLIIEKNRKSEQIFLGLATGGTYEGIYEELVEITENEYINWQNVHIFALDEYVWNALGYPEEYRNIYYGDQSYRNFLYNRLFKFLLGEDNAGLQEENIHLIDGLTKNPNQEAADYEILIETLANGEGLDLQVLGIGVKGHIAFIEARSEMSLGDFVKIKTKVEELDASTVEANSRFFKPVPGYAITQGISTILTAKELMLVATGDSKKDAIRKTVAEEATAAVPASVLQLHGNATVIADANAAEGLLELARGATLASNANLIKSSRRQQVDTMDQIIAVPAANVIADKIGFEEWIVNQPENIAVVIMAMPDEYKDVMEYKDIAYIKVVGEHIKEDHSLILTELFGSYEKDNYFGGFKLGEPYKLDKYKAVVDEVAFGI